MELSEAFVRVIGRHIVMIAVLVVVGALGTALLLHGDSMRYRATVRLALDTGDPATQAQSTVIADTARALATSPSLVAEALQQTHVTRDPVDVATNAVAVQSLGSSGIVALSVRDRDDTVALALARRIAGDVIAAHDQVTDGRYQSALTSLQSQISQTQKAISGVDERIKAVGPLYEVARPSGGVPLSERPWADPNLLLRQRTDLVQTLGSLESQQATMQSAQSARAEGTVVDSSGPAVRVAGRLVPDIALGGLLGLLAGIAVASLIETFRPTLVGRDALARNLGAPVLAEVHGAGTADTDLAEAAMHLELAAVAARVHRVELLPMRRQQDVEPMAAVLARSVHGLEVDVVTRRATAPGGADDEQAAERRLDTDDAEGTGVVLVTPKVVRVSELSRVVEFFTISGWQLLGLIVVPARPSLFRWGQRRETAPHPFLRHPPATTPDSAKGDRAWTSRY